MKGRRGVDQLRGPVRQAGYAHGALRRQARLDSVAAWRPVGRGGSPDRQSVPRMRAMGEFALSRPELDSTLSSVLLTTSFNRKFSQNVSPASNGFGKVSDGD